MNANLPFDKAIQRPANPAMRRALRLFSWSSALRQAVLIAACFLVLLPAYFMLATALKTPEAYSLSKFSFPTSPTLDNFNAALRGGRFVVWFLNSAILAISAVAVSLAVSALAAFAIARMRFRGATLFLGLNTALMVIPPVVMLIPLFLLLTNTRLIGSYAGAALVYAGLLTPFSVYLLVNFFRAIPHEVIESALIDGAAPFMILLRIVLPLSVPALVTLVVVNGLWVWNDLLIALILLPRDDLRTLMVGITVFGSRYNNDVPVAMAGMLLASLPMLLVYIFGQRYFIRGLIAGAVKG
ncbi:MAG: carbohydrate ABC transporter permease [Anaerolineae bacterium]|nr:carbohydrate ABC transporter permease [Thermoflexales bacterium]MDW8406887.1 carbohydrate ABC transporter permease [Anaerolineae bacterium]